MCIIHELGEVYIGDFTIFDDITKKEKHLQERNAIKKIIQDLDFDNDFLELWDEFEDAKTPEAILVKNLDQLEFLLQACSYGYDASYFKRCCEKITDEYCKKVGCKGFIKRDKGKKKH